MKNLVRLKILFMLVLLISSCGKGTVDVTNESYEPKIVIEGFLVAHQNFIKIHVARNFKIDEDLTRADLLFDRRRTEVTVTELESAVVYRLTYHLAPDNDFDNYYWEYRGTGLQIECGKTYRLDVRTTYQNQILRASAVTTVPQPGFKIAALNYDSLTYRQLDEVGNMIDFELTLDRSPGTTFYVAMINALNANTETFIYENPFVDLKPADVKADLDDYFFDYQWIQDTPPTVGQSSINFYWGNLWFYGKYEIVVYAADTNYKEFLQTYNNVQEDDGNFHEPKFNIEGDGMGIFGSMIADTVYFEVLRK